MTRPDPVEAFLEEYDRQNAGRILRFATYEEWAEFHRHWRGGAGSPPPVPDGFEGPFTAVICDNADLDPGSGRKQ